jgi:hypothetical protein
MIRIPCTISYCLFVVDVVVVALFVQIRVLLHLGLERFVHVAAIASCLGHYQGAIGH